MLRGFPAGKVSRTAEAQGAPRRPGALIRGRAGGKRGGLLTSACDGISGKRT